MLLRAIYLSRFTRTCLACLQTADPKVAAVDCTRTRSYHKSKQRPYLHAKRHLQPRSMSCAQEYYRSAWILLCFQCQAVHGVAQAVSPASLPALVMQCVRLTMPIRGMECLERASSLRCTKTLPLAGFK